jgi:NADH-quinone oxidoreductase subunit J
MLGILSSFIVAETAAEASAAMPSSPVLVPSVVLALCVFAGVGTLMLLPTRRDVSFRRIGGTMVVAALFIFVAILLRNAAAGMNPYFWIFSFIALASAVRVITHPRPVYSALYFVLTVFASAGLFVLLQAEFMAAALVLIYAGAILITYVFVIMLASQAGAPGSKGAFLSEYDAVSREPMVASTVGFALMGILLFVIFDRAAAIVPRPPTASDTAEIAAIPGGADLGNTQMLGIYLFQHQTVNLELAGLLLTVSMVGAIVIARKRVVYHEGPPARIDVTVAPATPIDDNPFSIPVYGTDNPLQKAYPET